MDDPWAHRRGEPRTFAAIWLLFLFASTILSVGAVGIFGMMTRDGYDVYRPAARIMLEAVTVGVVILWPMVRLSQQAPERPFKAMAMDALVVLGPAQAVIWPQALSWMAGWPLEVVGMAAGLLTGWGVLVAGLLAFYFGKCGVPRGESRAHEQAFVPRWAMMALIVLLVGIGPVLVALSPQISGAGPSVDWLMTSPLTGIYEVTRDRPWTGQSAAIDERHRMAVWIVWLAAAGVWGVAWAAGGRDKAGGVAKGERAA
jgi:hypothetical protein